MIDSIFLLANVIAMIFVMRWAQTDVTDGDDSEE